MRIKFNISDFDYFLPAEKIAQFPLNVRDQSRLIVFNKDKTISHHFFYEIPELIPKGSLLVRNSSKVLPARFFFQKPTGGKVEVLLVEPVEPSNDPQLAIASQSPTIWKTIIGGKRIRKATILNPLNSLKGTKLYAEILEKNNEFSLLKFVWEPSDVQFSKVMIELGHIPLPPYIKRLEQSSDYEYYQTVYASSPGSVAAPTAGLHFTKNVLSNLEQKNITFVDIVLHIGPGTFKPIENDISQHLMHSETFTVKKNDLESIYQFILKKDKPLIAVGTTSVRAIESLFWLAYRIFNQKAKTTLLNPKIRQWEPYLPVKIRITTAEALEILLNEMERNNIEQIFGSTQLFIIPSYKIQFFEALITNFHLPRSTLLLLVASFVNSYWKDVYQEALNKNYRFLSYGDSSFLWKIEK